MGINCSTAGDCLKIEVGSVSVIGRSAYVSFFESGLIRSRESHSPNWSRERERSQSNIFINPFESLTRGDPFASNVAVIFVVIIVLADILKMGLELTIVYPGWVYCLFDFSFKLDAFIDRHHELIKHVLGSRDILQWSGCPFLPSTALQRYLTLFDSV